LRAGRQAVLITSCPVSGAGSGLSPAGSPIETPEKLIRSTDADKDRRLAEVRAFQTRNAEMTPSALHRLQQSAVANGNIFEVLMETAKVATLGQITTALYDVGGKYRRNM
jgi:methylmalonyl-CoA mutase